MRGERRDEVREASSWMNDLSQKLLRLLFVCFALLLLCGWNDVRIPCGACQANATSPPTQTPQAVTKSWSLYAKQDRHEIMAQGKLATPSTNNPSAVFFWGCCAPGFSFSLLPPSTTNQRATTRNMVSVSQLSECE